MEKEKPDALRQDETLETQSGRSGGVGAGGARWVTAEVDETRARALAERLGIPFPAARALVARGVRTAAEATNFLEPRLSNLTDPFLIPGMMQAVERIVQAIRREERILIFGDADTDGITGSAILGQRLTRLGGRIAYFISNRLTDGYGLTPVALKRALHVHRASLLISVDCGTDAVEAWQTAHEAGCDVVVTDHHEPMRRLPVRLEKLAHVVNPTRSRRSSLQGLAGVGVVFKLLSGLMAYARKQRLPGVFSADPYDGLDLVAVGTVADLAPLLGENRILVTHGLSRIGRSSGEGLRALIRACSINGDITPYHLAFVLGPRLNATGRFGQADRSLHLLLASNRMEAERLVLEIERANERRKRLEERITRDVLASVEASFDARRERCLVVAGQGWHPGVLGSVAARLTAQFHRPTVVMTFDVRGLGQGSCRSEAPVDLIALLRECADLLIRFGGHQTAAGLVLDRRNYSAFKERFEAVCSSHLQEEDLIPTERVDGWLEHLGAADERLLEVSRRFAPLGSANPAPLWGVKGVRIVGEPRIIAGEHLRVTLGAEGVLKDAIGFGLAWRECPRGPVDVLFHVQEDSFGGRKRVQLKLKDFRPSE